MSTFDTVYRIVLGALLIGAILYFAIAESDAKTQQPLKDDGYMYWHDIVSLKIDYDFTVERCTLFQCESLFIDVTKKDKEK